MTIVELTQAVKRGSAPSLIYCHGEESFLMEQLAKTILDTCIPADARDFNYNCFSARDVMASDIISAVQTYPVFCSYRFVHIKYAHDLPIEIFEQILNLITHPIPETILLFTAHKVDTRRKFFKEFKKTGQIIECKKLYDNQLPAYVRQRLTDFGLRLTPEAMELFCRRVGTGRQEIDSELEKVSLYLRENKVADCGDIEAVVSSSRIDSVFDISEAAGLGKTAVALRKLENLLREGESSIKILSLMIRHFRQLWQVKEMDLQRLNQKQIAAQIRINPYFVKGMVPQARRFSHSGYRAIFVKLLEADQVLKSSAVSSQLILEQIILYIARVQSAGK